MPERLRPRELANRVGLSNIPDDQLLAILIGSGTSGINVCDLARNLLHQYGSFSALAALSEKELQRIKGMGAVKSQQLKSAFELARRLSEEVAPERQAIRTPEDVAQTLREQARVLETELFWVLALDSKNRLLRPPIEATSGLLNASLAHPREIFKEAIRCNAAAVILAHNHPSGDPGPSKEDLSITKRLIDAGGIIGIQVLDHVVLGRQTLGRSDYLSLRESGLVNFDVKRG